MALAEPTTPMLTLAPTPPDDDAGREPVDAEELSEFSLYRMYDHSGRPLRYGIIDSGAGRTFAVRFAEYATHRLHRHWCPTEVDPSRTRVHVLDNGRPMTRAEAENIEADWIGSDTPLANHEFNPTGDMQGYINNLKVGVGSRRPTPVDTGSLDPLYSAVYLYGHYAVPPLFVAFVAALIVLF